MRIIIAVMFLSIMLTGSVFQSYGQTVEREGNSVMIKTTDIGLMLGMLGGDVEQKLDAACSDPSLGCSVSDGALVMQDSFTQKEGYYTYEADYGIPNIDYIVTVKKIPSDVFTEKLDGILFTAGLTNSTTEGSVEPINLQDAEGNEGSVDFMRKTGLDISYVVIMPGSITGATAGGVSGAIDGNRAEFMLSQVLQESKPIVVKSSEINWGYIIVIAMVIVLLAFAVSFIKSKKKRW